MPDVQCGLIGCGTVGGGVVARWAEEAGGAGLAAVAVRSPRKRRDVDLSSVLVTGDAWEIVRDPRIGLLIDASGDCEAARAWALEGFARGKSFVTAGKALVARHGAELEERAAAHGAGFRYEAAVAGALPVVALLRLGLSPGTVRAFEGVVNGTCSFILSRLAESVPFAAALDKARQAGLTEADSGRDTSGRDAADKLAILARLCGVPIAADEVPIAGIEGLRPEDVAFGRARGWRLTLLATFRAVSGRATASVAPAFVAEDSFLAQARDEENAILLDGGPAGWVGLLGRGAGRAPSAAAVLSDVRETLRVAVAPSRARAADTPLAADATLAPHYVRVSRPLGSAAPLRALQDALAAEGVGVQFVSAGRLGWVQAITALVPRERVRRALARLETGDIAHVAFHESARGAASLDQPALAAAGGSR
jgi:homoserine dehydrogenase